MISKGRIVIQYYLSDVTAWTLVLSNIIVMVLAVWLRWQIYTMLWIYCVESVGVGIFWFVRLLLLKNFYISEMYSTPASPNTESGRIINAVLFLLNFCGLQVLFFLMLSVFGSSRDWPTILMAGAIFVFNQFFSFFYNKEWKNKNKIDYDQFFFFPYTRIMPVYAAIWTAGMLYQNFGFPLENVYVLIIFILLKTAAEVIMYIDERSKFEYQPKQNKPPLP